MRPSVLIIAEVFPENDPGLSLGPRRLRISLAIQVIKCWITDEE